MTKLLIDLLASCLTFPIAYNVLLFPVKQKRRRDFLHKQIDSFQSNWLFRIWTQGLRTTLFLSSCFIVFYKLLRHNVGTKCFLTKRYGKWFPANIASRANKVDKFFSHFPIFSQFFTRSQGLKLYLSLF